MKLGARFYDPEIGRFISQDTYLGESSTPPSLHRYLYAYGNPTVWVDWMGYYSYNEEKDTFEFDGHMNLYLKDWDYEDPDKGLIVSYKDLDDLIKKETENGLTSEDEIGLNENVVVKFGELLRIQKENNEIKAEAALYAEADYQPLASKYLLEDGHMKYSEAKEVDKHVKRLLSGGVTNKAEHYHARFILNKTKEFFADEELIDDFTNLEDRKKADKGEEPVIKERYGEKWKLLPTDKSICHGPKNFKWISQSGRELVISKEGEIEARPEYFGTYNYSNKMPRHFNLDMQPYWKWKNLPNDTSPKLRRYVGPDHERKIIDYFERKKMEGSEQYMIPIGP